MAYSLPIPSYGSNPFGGSTSNNALQLILQLVGQASAGRDEARQANESRYNDILEMFGLNRKRALDALDNLSGQEVADANKTYNDKRKNLIADLADRGLSGSTKRIAVESMTQRERDAAVNRIKDAMALNRNATDLGFTDRATGVMERRSDPYPDTSNVGALVAQLAPLLANNNNAGSNGGAFASQRRAGVPQIPGYDYVRGQGFKPNAQTVIAQQAAQRASDDAALAEQRRREGMVRLTQATRVGGLEGEDRTREALNYLQMNGWAEQNPAQGVPRVQFQQTYPSYYYPNSAGYSEPYVRVPLRDRDPVYAGIVDNAFTGAAAARARGYAAARQQFMGSNDYQDAVRRLQAQGIGVRPNPGFAFGG